jgi:integrase
MTRKVLSTLHLVPEHARSQDLVAANAATRVKVIGRRDEGSKKVTPPSKEAMRALLAAAEPKFRTKLKFAAATAVRASELHALRWRHFDAVKSEVQIETRVDCWGQEAGTKTEAGARTIPLGAAIVTMLKAWRLQSRFSRDNDLMFPNKRGRYQNHGTMSSVHFRPTCRRAGVEGVTWHGLRHFGISCWIERGLSPKTVQTFAGHTSMQMTMDRYGHHFPNEDHKTVMDGIADELFG